VLPNCPTPLLGRDILTKFQATLTLHPSPQKPQAINPLSPSSQSLLIVIGALLPQTSPNYLPLLATLVDPIVRDLKTPPLPHIMSQLSLLSKILLLSQTNLNITSL
jgi:hypothetical protein